MQGRSYLLCYRQEREDKATVLPVNRSVALSHSLLYPPPPPFHVTCRALRLTRLPVCFPRLSLCSLSCNLPCHQSFSPSPALSLSLLSCIRSTAAFACSVPSLCSGHRPSFPFGRHYDFPVSFLPPSLHPLTPAFISPLSLSVSSSRALFSLSLASWTCKSLCVKQAECDALSPVSLSIRVPVVVVDVVVGSYRLLLLLRRPSPLLSLILPCLRARLPFRSFALSSHCISLCHALPMA